MTEHFRTETIDGVTVVTPPGPKLPPEAGEPLYGLVAEGGARRIVLDLSGVEFLSSNALGILVSLNMRVSGAGGRLRLCGLRPDLSDLFRLTKIDSTFGIEATRAEALGNV